MREIWRRMQINPERYLLTTLKDVWWGVLNGSRRGVIFSDYTSSVMEARSSPYCNWGMLHDTFLASGFGFAFHKGSPHKPLIDFA